MRWCRPVLHEGVAVSVTRVLGGGGPASINNYFNLIQCGVEAHIHHHSLVRRHAVVVRQGHGAIRQLHAHQEGARAHDDVFEHFISGGRRQPLTPQFSRLRLPATISIYKCQS